MTEYITLTNLAVELGLDRSNMRKYVLKHGFEPVKIRTPESRGQLVLALSVEDAEAVRELRSTQGFTCPGEPVLDNHKGYFYVIQVVPDLAPNRVKLGFSNNVEARLSAHRTSAPTAELVKSWPCHVSWEQAAIASITRTGCTHIANEVYECENLDNLIEYGDAFFAIMPLD